MAFSEVIIQTFVETNHKNYYENGKPYTTWRSLMTTPVQEISDKIGNNTATICIMGLGYVGLPTAIHFAEKRFRVIGADVNKEMVSKINSGSCPLTDLNLDERMRAVVANGSFSASTDIVNCITESDIILIIVPTPVRMDKQPDLSYVNAAGRSIADALLIASDPKLIILESTVYPGVTEEVLQPIIERSGKRAGEDFGLAYCPERYNPGDPEHTIEQVARIVGGYTIDWGKVTKQLYDQIIREEVTVVKNIRTAEAAKVIENTQRDLNIGLMNELSMIFERMGIDIIDVIKAAGTKWNFNTYYPGAGVGGHCLPVDPYYLVKKAEELGYHSQIITAGRAINDYMPFHLYEMIVEALNSNEKAIKGSKIVILGISYKKNVGDLRESPVKHLLKYLKKMDAMITVVDPFISDDEIEQFGVSTSRNIYDACEGADVVVVATAHDEFTKLDLTKIRNCMKTPVFIDGRRIYNPIDLKGFTYRAIGRDHQMDP